MERRKICVVIPAYNEEKAIFEVVRDMIAKLKESGRQGDVVVIDDLSTDRTQQEARRAGAIVIGHLLNTGAGGATATGLEFADRFDYDLAISMDGDGQHLSADVIKGIKEIARQKVDLLIGSRLILEGDMSRLKIIGNKGLSLITNALFGVRSTDSQSGLRVFSRRAIERLRWESAGFEFCSEMIWRAKQQKLLVGEFPIKAVYTDYSRSKGQSNWNAIGIIKNMVKHRLMELIR